MIKLIVAIMLVVILVPILLSACARTASEPVRPDGLDKRLSLETMAAHDKIEPDALKGYEVSGDAMQSVFDELIAIDEHSDAYHLISEPRQALYAVFWVEAEINNGGLSQYYYNSAGNQAAKAPRHLRELGLTEAAKMLEEANAFFSDATPPSDRVRRTIMLEKVEKNANETWTKLENRFYESGISFQSSMINYIREHREEFYKLD